MAIKFTIDGVGEVTVEGAAQEDTMQAILAAVSKTEKTKASDEKKNKKANEDLAKSSAKVKTGLEDLEDELSGTEKTAKKLSNSMAETGDELANASKQTVKNLGSFAASLALTATSVAVGFAKNFNDNAANPIAVGAALLNTGIDLLGAGLKIGVEAVSAFGGALLGAIPLIGGGLQRGVDGIAAVSKQVIDLSTTVLKAGNEMMAAEFQMTTKVMADMAKAGASFAGGMTEMRQVANESGIGIEQFGKVIANSRESIVGMGLSATEATHRLSRGMGALTTTFSKRGNKLRDEMLALGYGYEEQGELMASYAANERAAGRLKHMTDTELAQGTAQYAKDLKVLADITGKDAKKAMEQARDASLMADVMAQLGPEDAKRFQAVYASMPDIAKKGLLQFAATGGQAISDATTNVMMAQNPAYEKLIKGSWGLIKDSSKSATDVQTATLKQASVAGAAQSDMAKTQGAQINMANTMTGANQELATSINGLIISTRYGADAVDASATATEKNAATRDPVTKGFVNATTAVVEFQKNMATLATDLMPMYAEAISSATEKTTKMVTAAMQLASGKISMKQFAEQMGLPGDDGNNANNKMSQKLKADREKKEDELTAAQGKLRIGSRVASKASGTEESISDNDEIKAAKQNLKNAREAENKLIQAKAAYATGLDDAMGSLAEHATAEDKAAAKLKYNQKFIDDSAAGKEIESRDKMGGRTHVNAKGMADYFALPTESNPKPTTAAPADKKIETVPVTGVPTPDIQGPGKAKGGVSVGPTSGYHELLHGTEAVVPLPDGKSIPVKLDSSSLNAALSEHTSILNNILATLNKGNSLSSGILQNSY